MFEITRDNNRSSDSLSLVKNRVPTLHIAATHLERDNFMFMPGMFCCWPPMPPWFCMFCW